MSTTKPQLPTFDQLLASSDVPILVDFWAEWCGPCKMMDPVIKQTAAAYKKKLKVVKINIDKKPELAQKYGIQSIPTLMMFYRGKTLMKLAGAQPYPQLKAQIEQHYPTELQT